MRYAMMIIGPDGDWDAFSPTEVEARMAKIYAWLEKWSAKIGEGGAEFDTVTKAKTIRGGAVIDGPYMEAKEVIGGIVFLETDTIDEAVAIASEWPSASDPGTTIEIRPTIAR